MELNTELVLRPKIETSGNQEKYKFMYILKEELECYRGWQGRYIYHNIRLKTRWAMVCYSRMSPILNTCIIHV